MKCSLLWNVLLDRFRLVCREKKSSLIFFIFFLVLAPSKALPF